jgi:hypothetical protein
MTVVDFDDGVPLPIGTQLKTVGQTVRAFPLVNYLLDDIDVVSSTDAGWPTLLTGISDGKRGGVAIDYPGQWRNLPAEEIDRSRGEDESWSVIIAYSDRSTAEQEGKYGYGGDNG